MTLFLAVPSLYLAILTWLILFFWLYYTQFQLHFSQVLYFSILSCHLTVQTFLFTISSLYATIFELTSHISFLRIASLYLQVYCKILTLFLTFCSEIASLHPWIITFFYQIWICFLQEMFWYTPFHIWCTKSHIAFTKLILKRNKVGIVNSENIYFSFYGRNGLFSNASWHFFRSELNCVLVFSQVYNR